MGSHREYSRSMSTDNWREAKSAGPPPPDEEREVLRSSATQVRGMYNFNHYISNIVSF